MSKDKVETAEVTILTRVKAGGKVWAQGPATVPVDLLADLEAAGALADPPEPASEPAPPKTDGGQGTGAIEGLTDEQSQMLRNAIAGIPQDQRTAGGHPKADAVNAALKQAGAGFAVKAAQIAAAMP